MLALDIETASPDIPPGKRPNFRDTSNFELVAIAVGHRDSHGKIDTNVFFRNGGWEQKHRNILIDLAEIWCDEKVDGDLGSEPILTYNGKAFDEIHLRNWAEEANSVEKIDTLFNQHIDLSEERRHLDTQSRTLEGVCRSIGIEIEETRFDDYDLDNQARGKIPDGDSVLSGKHLGDTLGEHFIDTLDWHCENGCMPEQLFRHTDRELKRMIRDYAEADIRPLFRLHDEIQEVR